MIKQKILTLLVLLMTATTGVWAEESETIATTAQVVEGTHFTIGNNGNYADTDGMTAHGGITVLPKNGETITKVVISCTYDPGKVNDGNTSVSSGTKEITNGGATITVTGVNASTFTFTCAESNTQYGQFVVYYTEASAGPATVAVTGVTLLPTTATLTVGETTTLTPTVLPGDATDKSVTWSSSNEAVATVSNEGVVTAVAAGEATITVTATNGTDVTTDDQTATCTVTVTAPAPTYTVSLKEGTDDAAKWQGKAGTGEYQALPLEGVAAGTAVTVKYDGRKRVRSVKAVKKADPLAVPLTMEALTDGTIVVNLMTLGGARRYDYIDDFSDDYSESRKRVPGRRGSSNISWKYSVNGGEKTTINEETTTIDVNAGDKVQFYGNGPDMSNHKVPNISGGTAQVKVYGNIMSMLDEDNYATLTTLQDAAFYGLFAEFAGNTLTDASGLLLPATELAEGCYFGLFYGCTSLTAAPELPATTLTNYCYQSMFNGCTSLTTAPALPAATLAEGCYYGMFQGCTSLNSVTCMATDISAEDCTTEWLDGVATTGTFTKASGATWPEGANGIPSGWTVNEQ